MGGGGGGGGGGEEHSDVLKHLTDCMLCTYAIKWERERY